MAGAHRIFFGAQEKALRSQGRQGLEAATALGTGALQRLRHGEVRPEVTEILAQIKMEMKCDLEMLVGRWLDVGWMLVGCD